MLQLIRWDDTILTIGFETDDWTPINMTGSEVFFTVKDIYGLGEKDDDVVVLKKTISIFDNPLEGICSIELDNQDTDINPWEYYYDIQIKDVAGRIQSIVKDILIVIQDVTKDPELW